MRREQRLHHRLRHFAFVQPLRASSPALVEDRIERGADLHALSARYTAVGADRLRILGLARNGLHRAVAGTVSATGAQLLIDLDEPAGVHRHFLDLHPNRVLLCQQVKRGLVPAASCRRHRIHQH